MTRKGDGSMSDNKILGLCALGASVIIAVAIVSHARIGRYQAITHGGNIYIIDTTTGAVASPPRIN
jgi:phage terminase large subunit GpA-like protein